MSAPTTRPAGFYAQFGKRLLDIAVTALLSPLLVLLAVAIAVLVRLEMGRPIFFRQTRPGLAGRPFVLRKFRTMRDSSGSGVRQEPDGRRLSRLGAFLRRTSLDEIPEFLHVLSGTMSLVGPRPLLPEYLPLYSERQGRRHEVKPGITGLAQIRGRNLLTWDEKLELDVRYVETMSLRLDLAILLQTLRTVTGGKGVSADGHATMPRFQGPGPGNDDQGSAET